MNDIQQSHIRKTVARQWQEWVNLILAIWLFVSPWVLQFYPGGRIETVPAAWNDWVVAIVIGVFSVAALAKARPWEEWINLIAAAWLFVSPWVLGYYAGHMLPVWNSLIVGALVFILAIWDLNTMPAMAGRRA